MRLNAINIVALILVIIGAISWGLVGAFSFDLVAALFGVLSPLSRIIYVVVGIAGIYLAIAAIADHNAVARVRTVDAPGPGPTIRR